MKWARPAAGLPCGQRDEGEARRTVRRRTPPATANGRLHAATQRIRAANLKARKAAVREELANAERAAKAIQDRLDRLDEAFLFERSVDIDTYDRHAEKLREELTLARIDRHSGLLEELDVEGILAFAERVLPRAADLWVQASLDQRQRFQQLFFPGGIAFDGKRLVRTGATAPAFSYLREIENENERSVDQIFPQMEPPRGLAARGPSTRATVVAQRLLRARTTDRDGSRRI
jgi:hypothetical protein